MLDTVSGGSRTEVVEGAGRGFSLVVLAGSLAVEGLGGEFRVSDNGSRVEFGGSWRVVLDATGRVGLVDAGLGALVVVVAPSETCRPNHFQSPPYPRSLHFFVPKRVR